MPSKEPKNQLTHDEAPAYGPELSARPKRKYYDDMRTGINHNVERLHDARIYQQQVNKIEVKDPEYLEYFKGH